MEIDNEGFFRKADDGLEYVEVHALGERSRRICTTPSHTCAYCRTEQTQKECANCGAPHEFQKIPRRARPEPPESRTEEEIVMDRWVIGFFLSMTVVLLFTMFMGG